MPGFKPDNGAAWAGQFRDTAVHLSLVLMYLSDNALLTEPLRKAHVRPHPIGHFGCSPGLAFIWACTLAAAARVNRPARLVLGTGHAGPIWLSCALLEGNTPDGVPTTGPSLAALDGVIGHFGADGGLPTELCAAYPGVMWPTGELGHAAAIAHGHALGDSNDATVAVLGDGELEASSTLQALLHAGDRRPPNLTFVVNDNSLRMGGVSLLGGRSWAEQTRLFEGLGLPCAHLTLDDFEPAVEQIAARLAEGRGPPVLVVHGAKGAGAPNFPDGTPVAGTTRSHKAPLPRGAWDPASLRWLEGWLRATRPTWLEEELSGVGPLAPGLPPPELRISRPAPSPRQKSSSTPCLDAANGGTGVEAFVARLTEVGHAEPILLTSPDELSSNRLAKLTETSVEIVEVLNEQLCMGITIGAALAGRCAWHASYEAFAGQMGSLVAQHLKYLEDLDQRQIQLPRSVGVLLTSLGWRNLPSHRETSVYSSLLSTQSPRLRLLMPVATETVNAAVDLVRERPGLLVILSTDKTVPMVSNSVVIAPALRQIGPDVDIASADIAIFVAGDVVAREAMRAALAFSRLGSPRVIVLALEDLSMLYRSGVEAESVRKVIDQLSAMVPRSLVVAPFAGPAATSMLRGLIGPMSEYVPCMRSHPDASPGCAMLLHAGCTWIQLMERIVNKHSGSLRYSADLDVKLLLVALEQELARLRRESRQGDIDDWHAVLRTAAGNL